MKAFTQAKPLCIAAYCVCSFPRRQKSRTWGGRENTGRAVLLSIIYLPNPVVRHRGSSPATACVVTTKGASRMNCTSFRMIGSVYVHYASYSVSVPAPPLPRCIPPSLIRRSHRRSSSAASYFFILKKEPAPPGAIQNIRNKILEIKYCKISLLPVLWSFHPEQLCMYVRAQIHIV